MSDRLLKTALVFTIAAHGVAMATMSLFLLPGIPGGLHADIADRARHLADHPRLAPAPEPVLGHPRSLCFASWRDLLAYCVPQDRAMTVEPTGSRVIRQEIQRDIALEGCVPFASEVASRAADRIAGDSPRLSFSVKHVRFRFFGAGMGRVSPVRSHTSPPA